MSAPKDLLELARRSRLNSHSPYSGCKVGAAVRSESGKLYGGCNVENSSFPAGSCAETVAVQKAVSEEGPSLRISEVVVVTDATPPWPPCGICRQVLVEFAAPGAQVHLAGAVPGGETRTHALGSLLPEAFTPAHLSS